MKRRILTFLLLAVAIAPAQSPYTNVIFTPATVMTATSQTSAAIQLGANNRSGSYSAGTITLTGTALTTATFGVLGSSDGGATYYAIAINTYADPTTLQTTFTATTNGLYQVNLAGLTHIKFVTSGTFTATSISLLLTASPNAQIGRGRGGGSGGAVSSVFGRTGAVAANSGDYSVGQVTGAAPLASPALTGIPTAPTATPGTSTTQLATTAFVQAASTLPISTNLFHGNNAGAALAGTNTSSTFLAGYYAFGDSNTSGSGYLPAYPTQLATQYLPYQAPFTNFGHGGDDCAHMNVLMFTNLNPVDSSNPLVTDMIGTNDAGSLVGNPSQQLFFQQCQLGQNAFAATSSTNRFQADASTVTKSGTWSTDTTYTNFHGEISTASSSTLTATVFVPTTVLYVWYKMASTGGSFGVTIDGTPATDTISTLTTIPTNLGGSTPAVGLARFITTAGSHTVVATTTSATSTTIYAFGWLPQKMNGGQTGPKVYLGGVIHCQNDPTDTTCPGTAIANSINSGVAATLQADGMNVYFVDVRSYVDATQGMSAVNNCPASLASSLHLNLCGTNSIVQAFSDAIGPVSFAPVFTSTLPTTVAGRQIYAGNDCSIGSSSCDYHVDQVGNVTMANGGGGGVQLTMNNGSSHVYLGAFGALTQSILGWGSGQSMYMGPGTSPTAFQFDPTGLFYPTNGINVINQFTVDNAGNVTSSNGGGGGVTYKLVNASSYIGLWSNGTGPQEEAWWPSTQTWHFGTATSSAGAGFSRVVDFKSTGLDLASGLVWSINGDSGFSRDSAGVFDVGNGIAGNASGAMKMANLTDSALTSGNLTKASTGGLLANAVAGTDYAVPPTAFVSRGRTTALSTTTVLATTTTALYRLSASASCDTSAAAATVTLTVTYTDPSNTVQSFVPSAAACTTLGAASFASVNQVVNVKTSTNIQVAAAISGSPTFDVAAAVEQLTAN